MENISNPCTGTGVIASYQYTYDGDTIINSHVYKKILKDGIIFSQICYPETPLGYQGAFREDTIAKKAYLVLPGDTADSLLYDFNLQIGDTIKTVLHSMSIWANSCTPYVVDAIDSQLIGSSYRKKWHAPGINGCFPATYVEGMGNLFGFLDSYYYFEEGAVLLCFSVNNQPLYSIGPNTCNPVSIEDKLFEVESIHIQPNPISENSLHVLLDKTQGSKINSVNIYNSLGKKCSCKWRNVTEQMLLVDEINLSSGLYSLQLVTKTGKILQNKFIVCH